MPKEDLGEEKRKDIVLWKRVQQNLSLIEHMKLEQTSIKQIITTCQRRLDQTENVEVTVVKKLRKYYREADFSAKRIKTKVSEIKHDLKLLKTMQLYKEFSSFPGELNAISEPKVKLEWELSSIESNSEDDENKEDEEDLGSFSEIPLAETDQVVKEEIQRVASPPRRRIPVGSMVVAMMVDSKDPNQEWIMAKVTHYYPDRNKYQVEDAEPDDRGEKTKYSLSARYVLPIQTEHQLESVPPYKVGHEVLALYPNTTCFYKAVVVNPPSKNRGHHQNHYMVHFEDDDDAERWIERRMVLNMPDLMRSQPQRKLR